MEFHDSGAKYPSPDLYSEENEFIDWLKSINYQFYGTGDGYDTRYATINGIINCFAFRRINSKTCEYIIKSEETAKFVCFKDFSAAAEKYVVDYSDCKSLLPFRDLLDKLGIVYTIYNQGIIKHKCEFAALKLTMYVDIIITMDGIWSYSCIDNTESQHVIISDIASFRDFNLFFPPLWRACLDAEAEASKITKEQLFESLSKVIDNPSPAANSEFMNNYTKYLDIHGN